MLTCLSLVLAACQVIANEPVFSGPQPGEPLPDLKVVAAFGNDANLETDVLSQDADQPQLIVFVHERTRPAFAMANVLMRLSEKYGPDRIGSTLVYLTDDPTTTLNWMRHQVRQHLPKRSLIGISNDGVEGPGAYGLNRNVALTVILAKDKRVTSNFALVQPSLEADAPRIFRAVADLLAETQSENVADYLPNSSMRKSGRGERPNNRDPKLRALLGPLIQKDATKAEVDEAARKIEAYVSKHPTTQNQIEGIAFRIVESGRLEQYGTQRCQQYLSQWAKRFQSRDPSVKAVDSSPLED